MKRQPTEREMIFANDILDKGLISQTHKAQHQKKNSKMIRGSEQTFFQIRYADSQQKHEKMLNITNHKGECKSKP